MYKSDMMSSWQLGESNVASITKRRMRMGSDANKGLPCAGYDMSGYPCQAVRHTVGLCHKHYLRIHRMNERDQRSLRKGPISPDSYNGALMCLAMNDVWLITNGPTKPGARCAAPLRNSRFCKTHTMRVKSAGMVVSFMGTLITGSDLKPKSKKDIQLSSAHDKMCICGHAIGNHFIMNNTSRCHATCRCHDQYHTCRCSLVHACLGNADVAKRVNALGFATIIGSFAFCIGCEKHIKVGRWHDSYIIQRAISHRKSCMPKQGSYLVG